MKKQKEISLSLRPKIEHNKQINGPEYSSST